MDITLEKASDTNASLIITLKPGDYKAEVDKKLKQHGKQVSLKGFRPGHVPASVVQKMYGKGILVEEVNNLLSKSVTSYIRENKLQVVGDPTPNREEADAIDWDSQDEFKFSYELGLASDFEVEMTPLNSVNRYTIEAGDKEADETIGNLRTQFNATLHPDEAAEGDTIFGELKQINAPEGAEAFTTKTALPLAKVAPDALGTFVGKTKDETFTFVMEAAFPDEKERALATGAKKEDAGNLTGEFSFTIEDVTRQTPAEMNQEFFDKVLGMGAAEDEETFRVKVKEIIGQNYGRESENLLRNDVEQALLDNILISLPDEFLKKWLLGMNEGKFTPEQIDEQYPDFTKSAKLQLIKNRVAEKNEINVDFQEVMASTRQMVRDQFGFSGNDSGEMDETIDKIAKNYLMDEKNNGQNYTQTFNRVFDDKVIEFIKSQLTIVDQTVSLDEFRERANRQQA